MIESLVWHSRRFVAYVIDRYPAIDRLILFLFDSERVPKMPTPQDLRDSLIEVAQNLSTGDATPEWLTQEYGIDPSNAQRIANRLQEFERDESDRREQAAAHAVDQALAGVRGGDEDEFDPSIETAEFPL